MLLWTPVRNRALKKQPVSIFLLNLFFHELFCIYICCINTICSSFLGTDELTTQSDIQTEPDNVNAKTQPDNQTNGTWPTGKYISVRCHFDLINVFNVYIYLFSFADRNEDLEAFAAEVSDAIERQLPGTCHPTPYKWPGMILL